MDCAFIYRVLNALEGLAKDLQVEPDLWTRLRMDLRLLRTFVLCARKYRRSSKHSMIWDSPGSFMRSIFCYGESDARASLGSLLQSLEDAVNRIGKELDSIRLGAEEVFYPPSGSGLDSDDPVVGVPVYPRSLVRSYFIGMVEDVRGSLWSFTRKISESYSYITAFGYSLQSRHELMVFIDSLLANMEDLVDLDYFGDVCLRDLISSFEEKLTFFKRFFLFTEQQSFGQRQLKALLTHWERVTVDAAAVVFFISTGRKRDVTVRAVMKTKVSEALERIMSVEPQVLKIYIKALTATHWTISSDRLRTSKDAEGLLLSRENILLEVENTDKRKLKVYIKNRRHPLLIERIIHNWVIFRKCVSSGEALRKLWISSKGKKFNTPPLISLTLWEK